MPADLVLLTTKDERCEAFNKTASLDGETNLKPKLAIPSVNANLFNSNQTKHVVKIECHEPIPDLYAFNGRISYQNEQVDIDIKQFMHRGATICNSG